MRISDVAPPLSELPQRERDRQRGRHESALLRHAMAIREIDQKNAAEKDAQRKELNQHLRDRAAERRAKWLPEFEARVARHERISAEDIEDYGRLPPFYVEEDWGSGLYIWKPPA